MEAAANFALQIRTRLRQPSQENRVMRYVPVRSGAANGSTRESNIPSVQLICSSCDDFSFSAFKSSSISPNVSMTEVFDDNTSGW